MQILNATKEHVEYISNALAAYYSRSNDYFGYPRYKDDYETMNKHVASRIGSGESKFFYLVAQEGEEWAGFVNYMINEYGVGSILVVIGDSVDAKKKLIQKSIDEMKKMGAKQIEGEVALFEEDLLKIYKDLGIQEQIVHFKLVATN